MPEESLSYDERMEVSRVIEEDFFDRKFDRSAGPDWTEDGRHHVLVEAVRARVPNTDWLQETGLTEVYYLRFNSPNAIGWPPIKSKFPGEAAALGITAALARGILARPKPQAD